MPRLVPAVSKLNPPVVRGTQAKVQLAQPPQRNFSSDTLRQPDIKTPCPLCIEELDDTDRDFFPCPCGYQICLFCYEQVKEKCNSQCPGCRREYGEPVGAPLLKQGSDDRPGGRPSISQRVAGSPSGQQQQNPGQSNRAAAAAAAAAAALALSSSKQQRGQDPAGAGGARGTRGDDAAPAALPSGATWAAAALGASTRHPPSTPTAAVQPAASMQLPPVDTSSWPSLMDSTASSMRRPARQEPPHMTLFTQSLPDAADSDASRCRSSSPSSADLTPLDSHSSSSQDLGHDQSRSMHLQEAYSTPAGQAGRGGHGGPPPAAGGTRAAAASRSLAAASKAPPPGFGAAPVAACPTQQDPSVPGPPLGRFQPIQPPPHCSSSSQQQPHLQVSHSYYSLWSGLPGIELNLGQAFGPIHVVGAYTYPCNPPLGPFQGCYAAKPPPPGFGPSPYVSAQDLGAQNGLRMYQVMNSPAAGNGQFGAVRPSMAV